MDNDYQKVVSALLDTIGDDTKWHKALELICEYTGSKKAIIALRNTKTAELIIPTKVQEDHNSPLLFGFSDESIEEYISQYYEVDPWTHYERVYRPYYPYILSKFISKTELQQSTFWNWLKPQKITDSLVYEIGNDKLTWVAINLYFDNASIDPSKVITKFQQLMEPLKKAWLIGRSVHLAKRNPTGTTSLIEIIPNPAVAIDERHIVIDFNNEALRLKRESIILNLERGAKLGINSARVATSNPEMNCFFEDNHEDFDTQEIEYIAYLDHKSEFEELVGINHARALIIFTPKILRERNEEIQIWENEQLTVQEKALVRFVAEGGRLLDFQHAHGISKPRSAQISKSVRKKLNLKVLSDIHLQHQIKVSKNYTQV
ncbi:hypothetical protein F9L33_09580 [Amylibacter sp. SFDW26]|uniref:hypothetical protein n=1 Tax=Amylibacter sp. SFDW26 TaxID=2652722 RepID=UPI001261AD24|nr:hypothetical protein [Amylibacter sp. SFDW26]KAB7613620.1 hypothetical protein F9L33_09580 [Amylibacter sp. SFDW26]